MLNGGYRMTVGPVLLLIACLLLVALPILAQSSSLYSLSRHVIAGGGGRFGSATHTLLGTAGQPVVGSSASNDYSLNAGFWSAEAPAREMHRVFLPLILRRLP